MEDTCLELTIVQLDLALFAAGIVGGVFPCLLWGKMGGDEGIHIPILRPFLKLIHHSHIGAIIMLIGAFTNPFILGWGTGTALDDLLFHSFENYFMRKES